MMSCSAITVPLCSSPAALLLLPAVLRPALCTPTLAPAVGLTYLRNPQSAGRAGLCCAAVKTAAAAAGGGSTLPRSTLRRLYVAAASAAATASFCLALVLLDPAAAGSGLPSA